MRTTNLFTRLAQDHKPDCILSLEGPAPEAVPDPEVLARSLGSDAAGLYADACRPVYEDLRRIIGQLAGLLILARLTVHPQVADLVEMDRCRARWNDARERLHTLAVPFGLARHKRQLESAHGFAGEALRALLAPRPTGDVETRFDHTSLLIKRAYAHLQAASSQKARLHMVDFSHACCFCARGRDITEVQ